MSSASVSGQCQPSFIVRVCEACHDVPHRCRNPSASRCPRRRIPRLGGVFPGATRLWTRSSVLEHPRFRAAAHPGLARPGSPPQPADPAQSLEHNHGAPFRQFARGQRGWRAGRDRQRRPLQADPRCHRTARDPAGVQATAGCISGTPSACLSACGRALSRWGWISGARCPRTRLLRSRPASLQR